MGFRLGIHLRKRGQDRAIERSRDAMSQGDWEPMREGQSTRCMVAGRQSCFRSWKFLGPVLGQGWLYHKLLFHRVGSLILCSLPPRRPSSPPTQRKVFYCNPREGQWVRIGMLAQLWLSFHLCRRGRWTGWRTEEDNVCKVLNVPGPCIAILSSSSFPILIFPHGSGWFWLLSESKYYSKHKDLPPLNIFKYLLWWK